MNTKKEVYIPIEIKPREFLSQVYLAGELSKKGARVFIGSKSSMDRLIREKRNNHGVYLYKGGGSSAEKFKNISRRVASITVLDQEVTPALANYDYIRIRFAEGSLQYVSRLYYIGPQAKEAAIKCLEGIDPEIVKAFGWPRVDLWMPSKRYISNDAVKKIHAGFGDDFLLFSSDFGTNSQRLLDERVRRLELVGAKKTKYELEFFKEQQESSYRSFFQFLDLLRELDADSRIPPIIVRPHPAEDHRVWLEKTSDLKRTKVVYQGDITPWLLASKGLLHTGCTTAIEASISRVKTGFLASYSDMNSDSIVPQISPGLHTLEDVAKWAKSAPNEAKYRDNEEILKDHISFSTQGATEAIATDMLTLAGDCVSQSNVRKKSMLRKTFVKLIRGLRARKNKAGNPHGLGKLPKHNKMQDGITSKEIKDHLNTMYPEEEFHVVDVTNNLCLVEITGQ